MAATIRTAAITVICLRIEDCELLATTTAPRWNQFFFWGAFFCEIIDKHCVPSDGKVAIAGPI
jgi:hypothetical protein